MSDRSDQSVPEWVSALDTLLQRYWDLEQLAPNRDLEGAHIASAMQQVRSQHVRWRADRLNRRFANANCAQYQVEITPTEYMVTVPAEPPPDVETAALHAVLDWLKPAADYPPYTTPEEQQELVELRRRVIQFARDRLNVLESSTQSAHGLAVPLEGDDWHDLEPQVRRLLRYMQDRSRADLRKLCEDVWGKEYAELTDNAISVTISKANQFLRKREHTRTLQRVRNEAAVRWR
jgi:hypothetical protein